MIQRHSSMIRRVGLAMTAAVLVAGGAFGIAASGSDDTPIAWNQLPVIGAPINAGIDGVTEAVAATQSNIAAAATACAQQRGSEAVAQRDAKVERSLVRTIASRPASVEDADQRGFRLASGLNRSTTSDETPTTQPDPILETCFAEAARVDGASPLDDLVDSYRAEVLDNPEIATARTRWRACVAKEGLEVTSGSEAVDTMVGALGTTLANVDENGRVSSGAVDKLFDLERAAAIVVAECDRRAYSPVVTTWGQLERQWLTTHGAAFERLEPQIRLQWAVVVGV